MSTEQQDNPNPAGWADRPAVRKRIRWALYIACAVLFVADFFVHRHIVNPIEKLPAFYAIYGFAALVAVVLAAKGLRRIVKRDEDYYDR